MSRSVRAFVDTGIIDSAAALFARRGFAKTSIQDVADDVGFSKAGLLHHFPSKDLLFDAVLVQAGRLGQQVQDAVHGMPTGQDRDRRAVEAVVDVALAHPGTVSLLLTPSADGQPSTDLPREDVGSMVLGAFGVASATPAGPEDTDRVVRVIAALSGLVVLAVAANEHDRTIQWRPHLVATALDTLGHSRPSARPSFPDRVEA